MTHTINQTDTPKTDVVHTSPELSQGDSELSPIFQPAAQQHFSKWTAVSYVPHEGYNSENITIRLKNPDVRKKRNGGDDGATQVRSYTLTKIEV